MVEKQDFIAQEHTKKLNQCSENIFALLQFLQKSK